MTNEPGRILLVEDDVDHAELVITCLADNEIPNEVDHVKDGETAIAFLRHEGRFAAPQSSPRPQLVLLDLRLPRIDGLEVLREIKGDPSLKRIPVVVLTTSDADEDVAKAYDLHANSYLVKPVSFDAFNRMIEAMELFWLLWNRQPVDGGELQ